MKTNAAKSKDSRRTIFHKRFLFRLSALFVALIVLSAFLLAALMSSIIKTQALTPSLPQKPRVHGASATAQASQYAGTSPSTSAQAMCTMDLETGRVFFEHNADVALPLASTTKIVTAIAAIESFAEAGRDLDEKFKVNDGAVGIEGTSIYIQKGELLSARELLLGLMLRSGNDAANALALATAPSIAEFAIIMNQTAARAGATASNFKNPHGLHEEGHYTTARDLGRITAYAMKNPTFAEIVATKKARIDGVEYQRVLYNKNRLLNSLDGCVGVKTGFTKKAGRCYVSAREKGGQTTLCVVLNCGPMFEEAAALMTEAAKRFPIRKLIETDTFIDFDQGCADGLCAIAVGDFKYPLSDAELENEIKIALDGEEVVVTLKGEEIYRAECNVL